MGYEINTTEKNLKFIIEHFCNKFYKNKDCEKNYNDELCKLCKSLDDEKYKKLEKLIIEKYLKNSKNNSQLLYEFGRLLSKPTNERFKCYKDVEIHVLNLPQDTKVDLENCKIKNGIQKKNTCPYAGSCKEICVGVSKQGRKQYIRQLQRLIYLCENGLYDLTIEMKKKIKNKNIIFRLNNYSDIAWEDIEIEDIEIKDKNIKISPNESNENGYTLEVLNNILENKKGKITKSNIFKYFENVLFYDYTKSVERFTKYLQGELPKNYFLTFSYDKSKKNEFKDLLQNIKKLSKNNKYISIAFIVEKETKINLLKNKCKFEEEYKNIELIDGDICDCRIFDFINIPEKPIDNDRIKVVLLEYNNKTGLKPTKNNTKKYFLNYDELKTKLKELNDSL